ncbi:hypothetical protein CBG46_08425 [Actinobacillus succinogenes]|nr:hypothetical protein [Actinobacillus succinogenes]PHI40694.1 hypothetical protein CBG46_08425 [Actinobacillus succinogenes]
MSDIILVRGNIETIPFSQLIEFLDPKHKVISIELRNQILEARYKNSLISDGLETGILTLFPNGSCYVKSKQSLPSIKGLIFESYLTNLFNENSQIRKNAFDWCTNRKRKSNLDYFEQYKAIGTGFISTKNIYSRFYEPQSNADIKFIRKNDNNEWEPATELETTNSAGIQIKAITGNERLEIIEPLLSGKYTHVLTCLKHLSQIHSYDICMDIIRDMHINNEISIDNRNYLEKRIYAPEHLGIYQYDIDNYSEYIDYWYKGQASGDINTTSAVNKEIVGYKYNDAGLLIPV